MEHIWLVVWNMFYDFLDFLGIIIPTDFHIFQRGGSTTNQIWEFPKTWGYPIVIIHVFKRAESEDQGKSYEALAP